jgi:hypothetical protein
MPSKDDCCREIEIVTLNMTIRIFSTSPKDTLDSIMSKATVLFEKFKEGN